MSTAFVKIPVKLPVSLLLVTTGRRATFHDVHKCLYEELISTIETSHPSLHRVWLRDRTSHQLCGILGSWIHETHPSSVRYCLDKDSWEPSAIFLIHDN